MRRYAEVLLDFFPRQDFIEYTTLQLVNYYSLESVVVGVFFFFYIFFYFMHEMGSILNIFKYLRNVRFYFRLSNLHFCCCCYCICSECGFSWKKVGHVSRSLDNLIQFRFNFHTTTAICSLIKWIGGWQSKECAKASPIKWSSKTIKRG